MFLISTDKFYFRPMTKSYTSLTEIKSEIANGRVTVEGLVKGYLNKISTNAHLNAFNEVF